MTSETPTSGSKNTKVILLCVLIIVGAGFIFLLQTKNSSMQGSGGERIQKGSPAPDFTLPDLDGNQVSLADFRGKVVLLNIWATWCPPCVEEMPSMEKLHQEMAGSDFAIVAVSIDADGIETVRPFMEKHRLTFPALMDPKGVTRKLYRTTGVPESFILDKNGIVVEKVIGPRDWATPAVISFIGDLIRK